MSSRVAETKPRAPWLTRGVLAIGLASLFSDFSHEIATALLPAFLTVVLAAPPFALGVIEGVADGASSLFKVLGGMAADRPQVSRRQLASGGYLLTALATGALALVTVWPQALAARAVAWMARGFRSPSRSALLADNVTAATYGRAFGFERAMDSLGAVLGPLLAAGILFGLGHAIPVGSLYRLAFGVSLVPGVLAALAIAILAVEHKHERRQTTKEVGPETLSRPFKRLLASAGLFGMGNFAHSLLILRATQLLQPHMGMVKAAGIAIALYTWSNAVNAGSSLPAGILADRMPKRLVLATGYGVFALLSVGFMAANAHLPWLIGLFTLVGLYGGIVDTAEGALAAELVPAAHRGRGYGALAAVNGVGDLVSSVAVGALWTLGTATWGLAYAAVLAVAGACVLFAIPGRISVEPAQ
ncbi:MAG: MFS transporter [Cyanobacteria bacterium REEB65]|nr:MFS transporter [Cyanobacteria bacterium REEB65]